MSQRRVSAEYILPLRWADDAEWDELAEYLRWLVQQIDVTVVDGSAPDLRRAHRGALPPAVRIVGPDLSLATNGKVAAVLTAAPGARHPLVIIADDDVRYSRQQLDDVVRRLESCDIVRPQNYFSPLPWHARWDTARSLINRAFSSDFPGTLGVRTAHLQRGYDGDVLFENLELIRTVRARGGTESRADDLFVVRRPPTARKFVSQRVRQAYDSFAQPLRFVAELSILPAVLATLGRPSRLIVLAALSMLTAERGRRRAGGRNVYPATSALWAPLWLAERGVCAWLAVGARARGGVIYGDRRMPRAANSVRRLRLGDRAERVARPLHR